TPQSRREHGADTWERTGSFPTTGSSSRQGPSTTISATRAGRRSPRGSRRSPMPGRSAQACSAGSSSPSSARTRPSSAGARRRSWSAAGRPASKWPAPSPSLPAGACGATSATSIRRPRPRSCSKRASASSPPFPERLADYARRRLEKLGVIVRTGSPVEAVGDGTVTVGGEVLEAQTIVWGAGIRASPAAHWLDVVSDGLGRIPVAADLSVPDRPGVYAIGDTAASTGGEGRALPALAQVAKQQGAHLGHALAAELERGVAVPPFRFRDRGNAAVIGRSAAIFDFGDRQLKGGWRGCCGP